MIVHTMSRAASIGTLVLLAAGSVAQGPVLHTPATISDKPAVDTAATLSADALLINIPVVVRDKHGDLVQNLTRDSFALQVDDRPQTIRDFNLDKGPPLTVGVIVDTSMRHRDVIDEERAASSAFLNDILTGTPDSNKAFVVQFARQIDLLQDVTSSKSMLQTAIKQLTSSGDPNQASVTDVHDTASAEGRNVTNALYDSLFLSADEIMSKQKGRKALIVLSDGIDKGSKESLESAAEAALRADTVIYAIYFKGKESTDRGFSSGQPDPQNGRYDCSGGYPGGGYPGGGYPGGGYPGGYPGGCPSGGRLPQGIPLPEAKKTLQHLTTETGGRLFEVGGKDTVAEIYKQIGEELRAQYRLGYTPDKDTGSVGFHRIKLSLANSNPKDFSIEIRDGYYIGN
jgi:VWFA-related protein